MSIHEVKFTLSNSILIIEWGITINAIVDGKTKYKLVTIAW